MEPKRRKPVETHRVALNCLVAPSTKNRLNAIREETGESQGEIVDRALSVLDAITPESEPEPTRKSSRRTRAIKERAASDYIAQAAERKDIDYSDVDSTPTTHVATLDAMAPTGPVGKVSIENWRANRRPLLKPKDRK